MFESEITKIITCSLKNLKIPNKGGGGCVKEAMERGREGDVDVGNCFP